MRHFRFCVFTVVFLAAVFPSLDTYAQDRVENPLQSFSPAMLMPEDTFFYVEIKDVKQNLEKLRKSTLMKDVEEFIEEVNPQGGKPSAKVDELLQNPVTLMFGNQAAFGLFKGDSADSKKPNFAVTALGDAGITKAVNDFIRSEKANDKFNNITEQVYKGVKIYSIFPKENKDFKTIYYCIIGNKLFASSSESFVRQAVDFSGNGPDKSLYASDKFKNVLKRPVSGRIALLYVNADYAKDFVQLPDPLNIKFDNPLAQYIGFRLLDELKEMDYAVAEALVPFDKDGVKSDDLTVNLSVVKKKTGPAAPAIMPEEQPDITKFITPNTVCASFTRISFSEIWAHFKEFAREKVKDKLASNEDLLNLIFGGLDFEKEVLPSIGKEAGIIVSGYEMETTAGKISVPAGVFVMQVKGKDEETGKSIKQSMKTLVGLGLAFLSKFNEDVQIITKDIGGAKMTTVVFKTKKISEVVKPTYVNYGDFIIIGTLPQAVEDAVNAFKNPVRTDDFPELRRPFIMTGVVLDVKAVLGLLSADEDLLVRLKMSEGGNQDEATLRKRFAMLVKILGHFERLNYTTVSSGDGLTIDRTLNIKTK